VRVPQLLYLLYQSTRCAFLAQEKNSTLGVLWHLFNPLAMAAVLFVVFSGSPTAQQTPHFALFVLIGLIQFNFFANATAKTALTMLTSRGVLLNTTVPAEILVLQSLAMEGVTLACELLLVLIFLLVGGPGLGWGILSYPIVALGIVLLTLGASFLLASFVVLFTDLSYIWNLATRMLFFLTPIFYTPSSLTHPLAVMMTFNPLAQLVVLGRRCLLEGHTLSLAEAAAVVLVPATVAVAGWAVFQRAKPLLPDYA